MSTLDIGGVRIYVLADEELTIGGSEMENFSAQVDLQDLELEPGEYTHGVSSDDDEETGTLTYENPELEDSLLSLDPELLGEGEEMFTGVFKNSEGFTLQNGSTELSASDGAEVVDSDGDTFDILGGDESQDVVWHLDIEEGTEQVEITATVSYETDWDEAEFEVTHTYTVVGAPEVPYGLNLGGYFDEDTNQVVGDQVADDDGVLFYPLREDGETPEGVELLNEHNETQHAGPVTDPIFPQSISGTGIWNDELGYSMDVEPGRTR